MGTVPIRFSRVIFECGTLVGVLDFEPLDPLLQYGSAVHNCKLAQNWSMGAWRANAPRLRDDFGRLLICPGGRQCDLPAGTNSTSKAFDARGAFAINCTFPVHLVNGDASLIRKYWQKPSI